MTSPLAITAPAMDAALRTALTPTQLQVLDESYQHEGHAGANGTGFGTPFFTGKSRVAQHRLVYDALQEFIDGGAHAIAIEVL